VNNDPILVQIIVILCAAGLVGFGLRRLGQPAVVSEMVAGFLLGPGIFGVIAPELHAQIFTASNLQGLQGLVKLGIILFMFIVGLEFRLPVGERKMLVSAVSIGFFSVVLPLCLGLGVATFLYKSYAPEHVGFWPFAFFISVAFSISAFPVLARILVDRAIAHTPLGRLALLSAACADLLAWVLVGMTLIFASLGSDWAPTLQLLGGFAALVLVLFGVVKPLMVRYLPSNGEPDRKLFLFILIGLLLTADVANRIHMHEVLGAFLFGLCMPRHDGLLRWFRERIEPVAVVVLMPLFFALAGLKNTSSVFSADTVGVFALVLVTAIVGKMSGTYLGAKLAGYPSRTALSLGALMNARGLMELVVIKIGLDAGLINSMLFTIFLTMTIVTTMMAWPLLMLFGHKSAREAPGGNEPLRSL
jgi:Kef-type K+ transport system membrane component KefB